MKLSPSSTAMGVGAFLAVFHFIWAVMIAIGVAQPFMDFIFNLHMITPPFQIAEFSLGNAVGLVIVTGLIGAITGWIFATTWNAAVGKRK